MYKNHTITKHGIEFEITYEGDDYPELDYLGTYTDIFKPGAINRDTMGDYSRGEYKYFMPENTFRDHMQNWQEYWKTEREARIECAKYVLQDYRRMEKFENGAIWMVCPTVKAYLDGKLIATNSISGIESDSDDGYLAEVENDLINEILFNLARTAETKRKEAANLLTLADRLYEIAKIANN